MRTIARSPFGGDDGLYLGGYDANSRPAHNTAWVLRLDTGAVLAGGRVHP